MALLRAVLLSPRIYSRGPRSSGTVCACSRRQGWCWGWHPPLQDRSDWNFSSVISSNLLSPSSFQRHCLITGIIRMLTCSQTLLSQSLKKRYTQKEWILHCFSGRVQHECLSTPQEARLTGTWVLSCQPWQAVFRKSRFPVTVMNFRPSSQFSCSQTPLKNILVCGSVEISGKVLGSPNCQIYSV